MSLKLYHIASFYRGVAYFSAVNSIVYLYQILWHTYRSSRRQMHDKPSKMFDDSVPYPCSGVFIHGFKGMWSSNIRHMHLSGNNYKLF